MKVTFFGVQPYDREAFDRAGAAYGFEICYHRSHLNTQNVALASGADAVCIFVNDTADAETIRQLAEMGVKLIALRCAGFNNVDLTAAAGVTDEDLESQSTRYMIGISDGLRYGIDAEKVETILTDHTITHMPCVPEYVRGIVNLRGQILPVIDLRLRLGKPQADENCIMVVNVGSDCMGILVDGVDKMVDVLQSSILPMPTQNPQKLISGMCSLPEGGTLLILDCDLLLHG